MNDLRREQSILPKGWALTTLGEVTEAHIDQGGPPGNSEFLYVDISSIDNKAKRIVNPKVLPAAQAPSRARQRLKAGDVLVSMTRPNLNAVALLPKKVDHAVGSTGFHILRTEAISPAWLYYVVQSSDFVDSMTKLVQGVLYPAVRPKDIASYIIPLAPLPEQERIVAEIEKQFTRLDAGIAALKRMQTNLKRYRASVLKAACEGRLVPTEAELARTEGRGYESADALLQYILKERRAKWEAGRLAKERAQSSAAKSQRRASRYKEPNVPNVSELPLLPEGWCWTSAEQCTTVITDGEHITPERAEAGVLLLSARNVRDGKLSLKQVDFVPEHVYERITKRLLIEPGNVLLSCSGSVGRSCVAPPGLRFTVVRSVAVLKPILGMGPFLSIALRSPVLQDQISRKKTQTAQSNIFQSKIKALVFPLPPLMEQERIVAEVERRLSVIEEIETIIRVNLRRAERLRQSILKQAFEGKLVPQDSSDEPAEKLLERIRAERAQSQARNKNLLEKTRRSARLCTPTLFDNVS